MKLRLLAAAAAALIMLGSGHAGATGSQGSHGGKSVYNGNQNIDSSRNYSVNTSSNTNQNASIRNNSNTNTARNDSRASARASADADAGAAAGSGASGGGASSVSVEGDDVPASGAAAVYVTTSDDTCMGSSSVGGQGDAFGFSVAAAWTDSNCIMLKNARELNAQGYPKAARARLCMNEENALAFELAGEPCPRALPSTQAALAKIRAAGPAYLAAAEGPVQLAMAGDVGGIASAGGSVDGGGADGAAQTGTLLAMVHTAVQNVAAAFAASSAGADPEPYTLYGIE